MSWILLIWVAVFLYRLSLNWASLLKIRWYKKKYEEFLINPELNFFVYESALTKLFKQAKLEDYVFPCDEWIAPGVIRKAKAKLFKNIGAVNDYTVTAMRQYFLKAEGVFRSNLLECFSPFYWIQTFIFLPSRICEYMGMSADQVSSRILQLLYWVLVPLFLVTRDNLYEFIRELMNQLP